MKVSATSWSFKLDAKEAASRLQLTATTEAEGRALSDLYAAVKLALEQNRPGEAAYGDRDLLLDIARVAPVLWMQRRTAEGGQS